MRHSTPNGLLRYSIGHNECIAPSIRPCVMKTASTAFIVVSLLIATSAHASCKAKQCSLVQLKVASCEAASLGADGMLAPLSTKVEPGQVDGNLLKGSTITERPTPCYAGMPAKWGTPDHRGQDFFVQYSDYSCEQLIGKVIAGETEHPCCDIGPAPGETFPGTCNSKTRLLKEIRIVVTTGRKD